MVKKLVRSMQSKLCELDLIPVTSSKEHLDDIVSLLLSIVNKLLEDACFSDRWRTAGVTPLIKKCNLDRIDKTTAMSHSYQS